MIIYNVTTKIEWSIAEAWLMWMKDVHIPGMMETGCFEKYQLARLLEMEEEEGPTYAVQYSIPDRATYNHYIENFSALLRDQAFDKWGNKFIAFRSLMEVVN